MYSLLFTKSFEERYRFLAKKHSLLIKRVDKTFHLLRLNSLHFSLRSHKVNTRNYGQRWSSRITGDLRLIWDYTQHADKVCILLLDIGSHSGGKKVYK